MEKIKCTIERITFQNPENGYSVLQATIKGYRDEQTLMGTFHEVTVGAVLTVEGNWRVDKRYGRQFAVEKWTEELPADIIGIEKYLGSGLVKGIGPKFAKLIVAKFGLQTFDVIENDADKRATFSVDSFSSQGFVMSKIFCTFGPSILKHGKDTLSSLHYQANFAFSATVR